MRSATEAQPSPPTSRLEAARRSFLAEPLGLHLLAVLLLLLVLALRHATIALAAEPVNDESIYFDAFERVARGESPFDRSGYLTFSLLAHLGAWSLETIGAAGTLVLLRLANLAGAATAVWCAAGFVARNWWARLAGSALYLVVAPAVAVGVFVGNLSLAVSGMIVAALVVWTQRPVVAGLLLGTSVVAKPLVPGAIVALACRRGGAGERRHLIAAGLAAAIALAVIALSPGLDRVLAIDPFPRLARSVSPHRLLHLLGWSGGVIWLSIAIALGVALAARRRRLDAVRTIALASTAAVATTPLVWSHTLLVTLPLQAISLDIAWHRYRGRTGDDGQRRRAAELTGVALAVAAIQLAEGA
ncbi:MAG: hypothetical protein R3244_05735, partial [Thermoanaerobaculia bacterium]|nr:hypothetical protein [Thermoanaerobaculia bacterium]